MQTHSTHPSDFTAQRWQRSSTPSNATHTALKHSLSFGRRADKKASQAQDNAGKKKSKKSSRTKRWLRRIGLGLAGSLLLLNITYRPGLKPITLKEAQPIGLHVDNSTLAQHAQGAFKEQVAFIRAFAQTQHEAQICGVVTGLNAFQQVIGVASQLSQNDPEQFLKLMNAVCFGNYKSSNPIFSWIGGLRVLDETNFPDNDWITFSDSGLHPLYQDQEEQQLSEHLWAFVNFGFQRPQTMAWSGNILHEAIHPGPSRQDYRLSLLGAEIGEALRNGTLTPQAFADNARTLLGTDQFDQAWEKSPFLKWFPDALN